MNASTFAHAAWALEATAPDSRFGSSDTWLYGLVGDRPHHSAAVRARGWDVRQFPPVLVVITNDTVRPEFLPKSSQM